MIVHSPLCMPEEKHQIQYRRASVLELPDGHILATHLSFQDKG